MRIELQIDDFFFASKYKQDHLLQIAITLQAIWYHRNLLVFKNQNCSLDKVILLIKYEEFRLILKHNVDHNHSNSNYRPNRNTNITLDCNFILIYNCLVGSLGITEKTCPNPIGPYSDMYHPFNVWVNIVFLILKKIVTNK